MLPQAQFGEFDLIATMGWGCVSETFRARKSGLNRIDTLKCFYKSFHSNPSYKENLKAAVSSAYTLSHKNVARVYTFGRIEETYYLSREYVPGCSLDTLLTAAILAGKSPPLSYPACAFIVSQVCDALLYVHSKRVAASKSEQMSHGGLHSGNIFLDEEGNIRVTDFCIAGLNIETTDVPSEVLLKKSTYLPTDGDLLDKTKTDVFSLGIVLFELLTGNYLDRRVSVREMVNRIGSARGNLYGKRVSLQSLFEDIQQPDIKAATLLFRIKAELQDGVNRASCQQLRSITDEFFGEQIRSEKRQEMELFATDEVGVPGQREKREKDTAIERVYIHEGRDIPPGENQNAKK